MSDQPEIIERVARMICRKEGVDPDSVPFLSASQRLGGPFGDSTAGQMFPDLIGKPRWHSYIKHARAVIEVMREPTSKMLEAGYWPAGTRDIAADTWQAMADAALV